MKLFTKTEKPIIQFFIISCIILLIGCSGSGLSDRSSSRDDDMASSNGWDEISGTAQKGPLQIGSWVEIYELDEDLWQTGLSFGAETYDNMGNYNVPVRLNSRYIEVVATGYYFDEISGMGSGEELVIHALADTEYSTSINVNILTELAMIRIFSLMDNDGYTYEEAIEEAQWDVLNTFGIDKDENIDVLFQDMNLLADNENNALLLAVSSIIMQMAHDSDEANVSRALRQIVVNIRNDLEDGILDDDGLAADIETAINAVDIVLVRQNLETKFNDITIPDFEKYIINNVYNHIGYSGVYLLTSFCLTGCDLAESFGFVTFPLETEITIDEDGNITGTDSFDDPIVGSVSPDGAYEFTSGSGLTAVTSSGTLSEIGEIEGTWTANVGVSGTTTGNLINPDPNPDPDPDPDPDPGPGDVAQFEGAYLLISDCSNGCSLAERFGGITFPAESEMFIDEFGAITGTDPSGNPIIGSISSDGTYEFKSGSGMSVVNSIGTISETNEVDGTWSAFNVTGTITGTLITE